MQDSFIHLVAVAAILCAIVALAAGFDLPLSVIVCAGIGLAGLAYDMVCFFVRQRERTRKGMARIR